MINKRAITLTSESASKAYDGTPLTHHVASITSGSLADGDTVEYNFTGTITAVGSTDNTFTADFGKGGSSDDAGEGQSDDSGAGASNNSDAGASNDSGAGASNNSDAGASNNSGEGASDSTYRQSKNVNGFDINDNYDVTYVYGTLTITSAGGGGGTTPTPDPTPTYTTTTIDPTPAPAAAAPVATPAVLGATRDEVIVPTEQPVEEPAVLGESRTRQTGDESQIPGRILLIMICAGAIATIMITTRKKEEEK